MAKLQSKFSWKSVVRTVAPMLGTALSGPLGGMAMSAVARAVLGKDKPDASEDELVQVLRADSNGDALARLRQAEQEFKLKMRRLDVDVERLDQKDRESARKRQMKTGDNWPNWLGLLVLCGFFLTVAFVLLHGVRGLDAATAAFAGTLVGYVSAKADQVVAYFFGSSRGSKEKTAALADAMKRF